MKSYFLPEAYLFPHVVARDQMKYEKIAFGRVFVL